MVRFARNFFRVFRVAIILLPLLIGFRGYVYLRECLRTLAAPGTGVDFRYQARKGATLHITADSYSFLWNSGTLHVVRPRLQDSSGALLASADSARIAGIRISGSDPIEGIVRNLRADLVRLKDGRFALEEYLPERTPRAQERPYNVRIDRADVNYIDHSGRGPFRQQVASDEMTVQGLGDSWIASGRLNLSGVGVADAAIQRHRDIGLLINLESDGLSLARAVDHFRTTPEGRRVEALGLVTAKTLVTRGPVRVFVPERRPFHLAAALKADAWGVTYQGRDRYDTARFQGLITSEGVQGNLVVNRRGTSAGFAGSVTWAGRTLAAGVLDAALQNRADLPFSLRRSLPADMDFQAMQGHGWFSYGQSGFRFDGPVSAQKLTIDGQQFRDLAGVVRASGGVLRLEAAKGLWRGTSLSGQIAYFPASKSLKGRVTSGDFDLAEVSQGSGLATLKGRGSATAVLDGTISEPVVALRVRGRALYDLPGAGNSIQGLFEGSGSYTGSAFSGSLVMDTATGQLVAAGSAKPSGGLGFRVAARNVGLRGFVPELGGRGSFSGALTGTFSDPRLIGRAQVLDLEVAGQTIPFVVANISATRNTIRAESLHAAKGSAQARGSILFSPRTGALTGTMAAKNLPLSDLSEHLSGVADVGSATVRGTLDRPIIEAALETRGLVVANRPVGSASARLSIQGTDFQARDIRAEMAGGTIVATAAGNFKTRATNVEVSGQGLSLPELAPELAPSANIEGRISGSAVLGVLGTDVRYARASGQVADVILNRTLVGSGSWSANASPATFGGGLQIGTLDRYLDLSGLAIDRQNKTIRADLTAYQIPLPEVRTAVERYLPEPVNDFDRRVRRIEGVADARVTVSGSLSQPTLDVTLFELERLALEGRQLGTFSTKLLKSGPIWTVVQLGWEGPVGTLRSSGVIDEKGDTNFEGDVANFDLGLLSLFSDKLTRVGGRAGLSFAVTGPTRNPVVQATLDASRTMVATGSDPGASQLEFGLVLDTISVSQSSPAPNGGVKGGLVASGKLFYRGLVGNLSAHLPLQYPLTLPSGQPLEVALDLPDRDLQSLSEYFPSVDPARTRGTIGGRLGLGGVIGGVKLSGNVTARAESFALKPVQTTLNDASLSLRFADEALHFDLSGTSSEGGSMSSTFESPVGDVSQRIQELSSRGVDAILDRSITGGLAMKDFGIKWDGRDQGRLRATANAELAMSGPLRKPSIRGTTSLSGVNAELPSFEVATATVPNFIIDPEFNVTLALADTARVNTSLAGMRMMGDGTLNGSLSAPDLVSNFTVLGGTIGLPNATVRIDPGGTVQLRYITGPAGDTLASLNVDLMGTAGLTASLYGDLPQHFDITLRVRGDLLQEGQALITAESDPPGLSQERILALLGQQDLIAALAGSVSKLQASQELRNALAGYAVPALLSPVTTAFARGLGLEYLDIAYDPFTEVTLSFAKELGRNLTLQGRRQLSAPVPGFKPQYDLRLVYRLPFGGRSLRRTSFSIGADQDRPWKVAVEYGFRF